VIAVLNPPDWVMPTFALLGPLAAILLTLVTGGREDAPRP
jgi:hypothetical protein